MLRNVLIFWIHGTMIYSRMKEGEGKDPNIVSGFLSAFSNFAKELGEGEIKSINMHRHMILMGIEGKLCFTTWFDQDDDELQGKLILEHIIEAFLAMYPNLNPKIPVELTTFEGFNEILEEMNHIKNVYELVESTNKILTIPEIQKMYKERFKIGISPARVWLALNFLVKNDAIRSVKENNQIRYRKKGELLKGLSLKFKKEMT
ncbi:MAG: hypothetical protein ACTSYB_09725 [Candidatus Helarchaeota archaeon]